MNYSQMIEKAAKYRGLVTLIQEQTDASVIRGTMSWGSNDTLFFTVFYNGERRTVFVPANEHEVYLISGNTQ